MPLFFPRPACPGTHLRRPRGYFNSPERPTPFSRGYPSSVHGREESLTDKDISGGQTVVTVPTPTFATVPSVNPGHRFHPRSHQGRGVLFQAEALPLRQPINLTPMMLEIEHEFGTLVYLKTDRDQKEWIITCVQVNPGNSVIYRLGQNDNTMWAYPFEFALTRDTVKVCS